MSTRYFHYYDKGWGDEILECPKCHWQGKFHQGATCTYADFTDCHCPNCDIFTRPMLAIVMHPTWQEMLDSGPPEDKARALGRGLFRGQGPAEDGHPQR